MPALTDFLNKPQELMVPTSIESPGLPAPADPFAGLEQVEDPFAGLEQVEDPFSGLQQADALDVKPVEELSADRETFDPIQYFSDNPDVAKDPKKLEKLLAVYRQRDKEGLKAGEVAKAAATEALPTVGKILGGLRDLTAGAVNIGVQPLANLVGSTVTGDIFDQQKRDAMAAETVKTLKKGGAELFAGTETAATGLSDLARTGARKLRESDPLAAATDALEGNAPLEKTDQELLQQLSEGAEFRKQMAEVVSGKGEALKKFGLDAETLAKDGIVLNPEVIERLSLVDPLTLVAGGIGFKAINAAGKTVFSAATRAEAEGFLAKLAARSATALPRAGGKALELTGRAAEKLGPYVPFQGPKSIVSAVLGAPARATGKKIADISRRVGAGFENSRTFQKALGGAVEGAALGAPLAAASEDDKTAGAILGTGALLGGAGRGAVALAESPGIALVNSRLAPKPGIFPETHSRGYGVSANLDAAHAEAIKSLPADQRNTINALREATRKMGAEIYTLEPDVFEQTLLENAERAKGAPLTADDIAQLGDRAQADGYFDTTLPADKNGQARRVVFLNSSANAATHEVGHLFKAVLSPERQADLVNTARKVYSPEEIANYKAEYEQRLNEPVTEDYILEELVAENFSQLFRNTPLAELGTPQPLLEKIKSTLSSYAEAAGIDLTGAAATPAGAPASLRFNDVVRRAAQELLQGPQEPAKPLPKTAEALLPIVEPSTRPVTARPAPVSLSEAAQQLEPLVEPVIRPQPAVPVERQFPIVPGEKNAGSIRAGAAATTRAPRTAPPSIAAAAESARTLAEAAPEKPFAGGTKSPRELLGQIAESIAAEEGVKLNYLSAPDEPAAAITSNRNTRRAIIETFRTMPKEARALWEKTFFPEKVTKTKSGSYQVQGWAPEVFAANAQKLAAFLSETPGAQKLSPYAIDPKTKSFTPGAWQELYADTQTFVQNQARGATGSGEPLVVPRSVTEAGGYAPPVKSGAVPLDQAKADVINALFGFKLPETPRIQAGRRPLNVVGQEVSTATKAGRVEIPVRPRGEFTGPEAIRQGIEGTQISEVNPFRNQLEAAARTAGKPTPSFIEAIQKLNLENIKEIQTAPEQPKFRGNSLTLTAGFQPRTVAETVAMVENFTPLEFADWARSLPGGFTAEAWDVGRAAPDAAFVDRLQSNYETIAPRAIEDIKALRFDEGSARASQAQFFREAYEAASGTGSAGQALRKLDNTYKPPFPPQRPTQTEFFTKPES